MIIIYPVDFTTEDKQRIENNDSFKRWVKTNSESITIDKIEIFKSFFFNEKTGFIYAKMIDTEGKINGITLLRGDSVCVLIVIKTELENNYCVLVEQYRTPVGKKTTSLPAGMVEGKVVQTLIKEIKEEVSEDFDIKESELKFLSSDYTSEGVLDEKLYTYYTEIKMKEKDIFKYQNIKSGSKEENEDITVKIVKMEELKKMDSRCRLSYYDYKEIKGMQ